MIKQPQSSSFPEQKPQQQGLFDPKTQMLYTPWSAAASQTPQNIRHFQAEREVRSIQSMIGLGQEFQTGTWGRITNAQFTRWLKNEQKELGVPVTGRLNGETITRLKEAAAQGKIDPNGVQALEKLYNKGQYQCLHNCRPEQGTTVVPVRQAPYTQQQEPQRQGNITPGQRNAQADKPQALEILPRSNTGDPVIDYMQNRKNGEAPPVLTDKQKDFLSEKYNPRQVDYDIKNICKDYGLPETIKMDGKDMPIAQAVQSNKFWDNIEGTSLAQKPQIDGLKKIEQKMDAADTAQNWLKNQVVVTGPQQTQPTVIARRDDSSPSAYVPMT